MKKLILYCLLANVLLWAACYAQVGAVGTENDKAAIRAVIAKETEAYYRQDFETWKSTYINESWFRYYGYWEGYPEKVRYFNGFDSLRNFKQKQFKANKTLWVGSTEERSNENFRIHGNMAWYTFEQASYAKNSRKLLGRSMETRIMEKQHGEWKIAYLGFHYLPQPDSSSLAQQ
jgi:hypothetical protein